MIYLHNLQVFFQMEKHLSEQHMVPVCRCWSIQGLFGDRRYVAVFFEKFECIFLIYDVII